MIEDAAEKLGYTWVTVVLLIASALTGGAVLRATGRVLAGWGLRRDDQGEVSARGDDCPRLALARTPIRAAAAHDVAHRSPCVKPLRAVHSGHVGDYATWLTVGLTGLGVAFAYAILAKWIVSVGLDRRGPSRAARSTITKVGHTGPQGGQEITSVPVV
jgi:hypothetical protein